MNKFSNVSLERLKTVHPHLRAVFELGLVYSIVDFGIDETDRTPEHQSELLAEGRTTILDSNHIPGKNGFAQAGDVHAWVKGAVNWEFPYYADIATGIRRAAQELGVKVRWGGLWDEVLNQVEGSLLEAHLGYVEKYKRLKKGKKPLIDGPHFELVRSVYPKDKPVEPLNHFVPPGV